MILCHIEMLFLSNLPTTFWNGKTLFI